MRFFIPHAADSDDAERIWAGIRLWLAELGLPTTRRRIRALSLEIDGVAHYVPVGGETPDGEVVMMILEASDNGLYYVCTPDRGMLEDIPIPMALHDEWRVIDFDEEVVGWA